MHPQIKEQQLEDHFEPIGPIDSVDIIRDPYTRQSRGFAFVTFRSAAHAQVAAQKLDKSELLGRTVGVQISRRGRARNKTPGRYLGNSVGEGDRPPRR